VPGALEREYDSDESLTEIDGNDNFNEDPRKIFAP
jgi:hypothetical protein